LTKTYTEVAYPDITPILSCVRLAGFLSQVVEAVDQGELLDECFDLLARIEGVTPIGFCC
jgi:hypothetical protein